MLGSSGDSLSTSDEGDGYTYLPWVDCICAGVPCQDVSVAGKRAGLKGERTGLFYDFARILQELRPTWFVFENVPGLLSSNGGRDFAEVLRVLMVECGYGVQWRVLDSQFFGVAQERRRLFVVGRFGKPCPATILFEPNGVQGNTSPRREKGKDIAGTLGGGSRSGGFGTTELDTHGAYIVCGTLTAGAHPGSQHAVCLAGEKANAGRVGNPSELPEGMDSARYRALGNAVTSSVAEWIGRRIVEAEERLG